MNEPNDGLQRLKDFSLRMKHDLELVEAKAPAINDLVEQLSLLGVLGPNLITGQVVFQRPANAMSGHDTGEVIQSALAVPAGLGLIFWDCHWSHNGESHYLVGKSIGEVIVRLLRGQ